MKTLQYLSSIIILSLIFYSCSMPEGPVPLSGDVPESEGWEMEVIVSGLENPWGMVWISNNEILVTERPGKLRIIKDNELQDEPIYGLPEIYADGQGGLMDITKHPEFEENGFIYITYSAGDEDSNRTTIGRGKFDGNSLNNFEVIFEVNVDKSGNQHFGSKMLWLPDGTFLVSIGDGGNYIRFEDGNWIREQAQNTATHLGSILHLTDSGKPAQQMPLFPGENTAPELWSIGHRNVQGMALDSESGNVWANEHGSRGGDELNLLMAGENYGWPEVTYSREYHYTKISSETTRPGMVDPKVVWTPAQAPSGLTFYYGDYFPDWQGNLFSGGLKGEQVRRIILDGEEVVGEEKLTIGYRVRDVKQGPDGYLYILTDEENGHLIRIIPE